MLKTAVIASILLFSTTAHAAMPPCSIDDNECLLRLSLQQTYDLEACQQRAKHLENANQILNKALDEEEARSDHGGRVFVMGIVVGATFVGLATTIALKILRPAK